MILEINSSEVKFFAKKYMVSDEAYGKMTTLSIGCILYVAFKRK